jgi:hypothetical protein
MGKKLTIDDMHELAAKRDGYFLSPEYLGGNVLHSWKCKDGHIWDSKPKTILNKRDNCWCRTCSDHPILTVQDCINTATEHNGKFLSNTYKNKNEKYWWECEFGHKFEKSLDAIRHGKSWCTTCSVCGPLSIEILEETAQQFGGHCLSTEYKTVGDYYDWQCKNGHVWPAVAQNIRWGYWCPYCIEGKNETLCRKIFENYFNEKFIKIKPKWLKNPKTGCLMELDGYCEKLNVAFEYNGIQHYKPTKFSENMTDEEALLTFNKQKERDLAKIEICKINKTELIIIGCLDNISRKNIIKNVEKQLEEKFKQKG